jgi:SAM-dependent methyltransferase
MGRTTDEIATMQRFADRYKVAGSELIRQIERASCGCDYGATSWTTREEALRVAQLLELGPGKRLLDIGAGSGWPGLYFARETGCDLALADLPLEGLRLAAERARDDRLAGACWFVVADAAALPFRDGQFDAVSHSDVLCCLDAKLEALKECRRTIRPRGKMAFTVISIVPGLSPADYEQAVAGGPPFVATDTGYREMLALAGWDVADHSDLTTEYGTTLRRVYAEESAHSDALGELIGEQALADKLGRRSRALAALETGLLQREMFVATPAGG